MKKLLMKWSVATLLVLTVGVMAPSVAQGTVPPEPGGPDVAQLATTPSYRISDSPWLRLPEDMGD